MTPRLSLEDSVETKLYRAFVGVVKADPVVSKVVKTFRDWSDSGTDRVPIGATGQMPSVEFWPSGSRENYATPDTMLAEFYVDVTVQVQGLLIDNALNLWGAILRAVRPKDQAAALAMNRRFKDAGAETGVVKVTRPAFAAIPPPTKEQPNNTGSFEASGQFAITYFTK